MAVLADILGGQLIFCVPVVDFKPFGHGEQKGFGTIFISCEELRIKGIGLNDQIQVSALQVIFQQRGIGFYEPDINGGIGFFEFGYDRK